MDSLELIKRLREGELSARDELVLSNEGLVWSVVRRYIGRGVPQEDLFQIGVIGLIKAIDKFDLNLGLQLSTYAIPLIAGEIKRFLRDDGSIKVSRLIKENAVKIYREKERMESVLGRDVRIDEIAASLGLDSYDAALAVAACSEVESLYKTIYDGDGSDVYLIDKTSGGQEFEEPVVDRYALKEVFDNLSERDRFIIGKRYFENRTQSWIAEKLNISQVQVSRMEKKILNSMKNNLI